MAGPFLYAADVAGIGHQSLIRRSEKRSPGGDGRHLQSKILETAGCVTESAGFRCLQAPCECPEPCEGRSRGSAERGIGLSILSDHDLAKGPVRMAGRHGLLHQDAQSSLSGTSPAFVQRPLAALLVALGSSQGACNDNPPILSRTRNLRLDDFQTDKPGRPHQTIALVHLRGRAAFRVLPSRQTQLRVVGKHAFRWYPRDGSLS